MAVRSTLQIGNLALKAQNQVITDFNSTEVKRVIRDLTDTMRDNNLVGMAAPQIGENFKIFVTEPRPTKSRAVTTPDELRVYINPRFVNKSPEESIIYEACGCVFNGNLFAPVKRPREITIEAYDVEGRKFQLRCDGLLARVIQHEYDHLEGIEFTEKICDYSKILAREFFMERIRDTAEQIENYKITVKEFKQL